MAIGSALSFLAARDQLATRRYHHPATGEVIPIEEALARMSDAQVDNDAQMTAATVVDGLRAALVADIRQAPREKYRRLLHAIDASLARFATVLPPSG